MKKLFKILSTPAIPLLIMAVSTLLLSTFLNLTAYLTETKELNSIFSTVNGDEFGVSFHTIASEKDQTVLPGVTAEYDPSIVNEGAIDIYAFAEVTLPVGSPLTFGISSGWCEFATHDSEITIGEDDNVETINCVSTIYYYGDEAGAEMTEILGSEENGENADSIPFIDTVTIGTEASPATDFPVRLTAYVCQAEGMKTNPADVWEAIQ